MIKDKSVPAIKLVAHACSSEVACCYVKPLLIWGQEETNIFCWISLEDGKSITDFLSFL